MGVTVTEAVLIEPGIQVYVVAPPPNIATLAPLQILVGDATAVIVGVGQQL